MWSVVSIGVGSRKGGSEAHFIVFAGFVVRVSWVCAVMYYGDVVRRCGSWRIRSRRFLVDLEEVLVFLFLWGRNRE